MITYLRFLTGHERTRESNRHLGFTLVFKRVRFASNICLAETHP